MKCFSESEKQCAILRLKETIKEDSYGYGSNTQITHPAS